MASAPARIAAAESTTALGSAVEPELSTTTAASALGRLVEPERPDGARPFDGLGGQRGDRGAAVEGGGERRRQLGRLDGAQQRRRAA